IAGKFPSPQRESLAARLAERHTIATGAGVLLRCPVLAAHPAHRARAGAHDDALGGHLAAFLALDPVEQRAAGDAGRGEDAVAPSQSLEQVDAVEILAAPLARAGARVVVAEQQPAVELPADAAQRGRR